MHLERNPSVRPERFYEVGKKEHIFDVVPISHIKVKTLGVRFDPPDFECQIRKICRPKGGGAFEHRTSGASDQQRVAMVPSRFNEVTN